MTAVMAEKRNIPLEKSGPICLDYERYIRKMSERQSVSSSTWKDLTDSKAFHIRLVDAGKNLASFGIIVAAAAVVNQDSFWSE